MVDGKENYKYDPGVKGLRNKCKKKKWLNEISLNPLTPKILLVILLTVCHTVLAMLVWRI